MILVVIHLTGCNERIGNCPHHVISWRHHFLEICSNSIIRRAKIIRIQLVTRQDVIGIDVVIQMTMIAEHGFGHHDPGANEAAKCNTMF